MKTPSLAKFLPLARAALLLALLVAADSLRAEPPLLRLSVLQFGTAHWELDHLQRHGLDRDEGFVLDVRLVANLPASRIAVSSGDVDGAVVDLTWAQARHVAGHSYRYLPYSSQMGDVLAAPGASIHDIEDLRGKRIGVAGGPDSKGWVLLTRAAQARGMALEREAQVQFGAPPLLSQAFRRGQFDVLVTFWHFAAELTAAGEADVALPMDSLLASLDIPTGLPILGYVFHDSWADDHQALVAGFARAVARTKRQLRDDPDHWEALRPLMRVNDDAHFTALRQGYLQGIPEPLDEARVAALQRLLVMAGSAAEEVMPARLFVLEPGGVP
ncbi:MAG: ABC transporter substrate-binding protein [Billgrantia sp.]|uniref:ABC transporter substrate-binding protein n=1 Tax=Billgrantia desiderata TaxID=52021 RepID=UPI00089E8585|nr:ABC transporter substrate-binding protein [Halomonas desiderata]SEG00050.1 NitT/TauT family transport system substrate-binding protein [Halomonas desiderata]